MIFKDKQQLINIDKIEIPDVFAKNPPQFKKYNRIKSRCMVLEGLDKPLQVRINQNSILLQSGYIRYLISKELGFNAVPVILNDNVIIHLKNVI